MDRKISLAFVLLLAFAISLSCAASRFPVLPFDLKSYQEVQEQASPMFDGVQGRLDEKTQNIIESKTERLYFIKRIKIAWKSPGLLSL